MKWLRNVILLLFIFGIAISCDQHNKEDKYGHLDQRTKIRLRQYLAEGKRLFGIHCANCHQQDGGGLARLYPPIKGSDYLLPNKAEVICGMRYGQKGELIVNGIMFNQEMPANLNITDLEIAEIATYVFTEFADSVQIVTINEVRAFMDSCQKDSIKPVTSEEIKSPG